jgi:hypothetical protein
MGFDVVGGGGDGEGDSIFNPPPFMKVSDCRKQFRKHKGTRMSFGVKTISVVHPLFPILPNKLIPFHDYTFANDKTFVCEKNPPIFRDAFITICPSYSVPTPL